MSDLQRIVAYQEGQIQALTSTLRMVVRQKYGSPESREMFRRCLGSADTSTQPAIV